VSILGKQLDKLGTWEVENGMDGWMDGEESAV